MIGGIVMKRFSLGAVLILLFMLSGCKNINQRNGIPAEAVNNPGASFEATPSINGNKSIPSMQAKRLHRHASGICSSE